MKRTIQYNCSQEKLNKIFADEDSGSFQETGLSTPSENHDLLNETGSKGDQSFIIQGKLNRFSYLFFFLLCLLVFSGQANQVQAETGQFLDSKSSSEINRFSVFPQPVTGKMNISVQLINEAMVKIEFFDITGRKILEREAEYLPAGNSEIKQSTEQFKNGVYICKLSAPGWNLSKKIIVKK